MMIVDVWRELGVQRRGPSVVVVGHFLGVAGRGDLDLGGLHREVLAAERP